MHRLLLPFLLLLAGPALALDGCEDVWFTRNLIFDRAGYCFGSPLGQALFDNGDCTGKDVTLAPAAKRVVDQILAIEAQFGCKVDTSRTWLDMDDMAFRRVLIDLPIRDEFESGCLGWTGATVPLFAGVSPGAPAIGRIEPGDWISFAFVPQGNAAYVTIHGANWGALKSAGWLLVPTNEASCQQWAG